MLARCRSSARSWRTAGGAIHASGSRSARSSCAKIAAPALVVLQPGRGDRLAPQRVHQVRIEAVVLQQLHQPAPSAGRLFTARTALAAFLAAAGTGGMGARR